MNLAARLFKYMFRYWRYFLILVAGVVFSTYFKLQIPGVINIITKEVVGSGDLRTLTVLSAGIVALTAAGGLGDFILRYGSQFIGARVTAEIRSELFASMQEKPFSFYDRNQTGQLMARATGDVEAVRRFVSWGMGEMIGGVVLIGAIIVRLSSLEPSFLPLISSIVPLILFTGLYFSKKQRPIWTEIREKFASVTEALRENIVGVRVVRAFSREEYEKTKFDSPNKAFSDANIRMAKTRATFIPLMPLIVGGGTAAMFLYGGGLVMDGKIGVNDLMEAYALLLLMVLPVRMMGFMVTMALNAVAGLRRVFEIVEYASDIKDSEDAVSLEEVRGELVFEDVAFGYDAERLILKNINLKVEPGESIALVGATGSGKSTLINLIPRFYDVIRGRITVDGLDVKKIKLKSLRTKIGVVSQEPFLFSASIRENISLGSKSASLDEVIRVSEIAKIRDFISSLPQGYDTLVGERGVTLSGGQRQRVAIARALLIDPRILIFDDSTSSVDVETEFEIQEALKSLMKKRTTLIITQRLSTIRIVDRIAVFNEGELVEVGTNEELLNKKGVYHQIYTAQIQPQEVLLAASKEKVQT